MAHPPLAYPKGCLDLLLAPVLLRVNRARAASHMAPLDKICIIPNLILIACAGLHNE